MAAPIDLSGATTIEGQLLMVLQEVMNRQEDTTADTGLNRDDVTVILSNSYNDVTGVQAVTLSIPITSTGSVNGYTLTADEVFYPKV